MVVGQPKLLGQLKKWTTLEVLIIYALPSTLRQQAFLLSHSVHHYKP